MHKTTKLVLHVLFWLLLGVLVFFAFGKQVRVLKMGSEVVYRTQYAYFILLVVGIDMALKATFAYANMHFLIPADDRAPNSKRYILRFCALGVATYLISAVVAYFSYASHDISSKQATWYWFSSILHIFIGLSSIGLKLAREKQQMARKQQEVEASQLNSELDFLTSQINPHFLFNTLNNLYGSAQLAGAQQTADGIAKLSGIMRYMIDDKNQGFVSLSKEVSYIKDLMAIQDLRMQKSDPVEVSFNIQGNPDYLMIAPLILIPFVENAYKHGIHIERKSVIKIDLIIAQQSIEFRVENSIHRQISSGTRLGLENVKRRLALIYPDAHQLSIADNGTFYSVILNIELKRENSGD